MRRFLGPVCFAAGPFLCASCLLAGLWICTCHDARCLPRDSVAKAQCARSLLRIGDIA